MARPTRLALLPLGLGLVLMVVAITSACGGSSGEDATTTSTAMATDSPTTVDPLAPVLGTDPTRSVVVGPGRRFELVLPADPTRGWHWELEPVDTAVVVPLSSEFRDDRTLLSSTSTSTSTSTTTTIEPMATGQPATTTSLDPDAPEAAPLVQVTSFAGRTPGITEIRLRYVRIGGNGDATRTVTFTVVVLRPDQA